MTRGQILLVEDEKIVTMELKDHLSAMGYEIVAVAASAEEALQTVDKLKPELVLMDIMLRGPMDGIEAAEQIRARFGIPVIYLTAYADKSTLERAKRTEPYGYIVKPFEESSLQATIEMALSLSQAERKLRESEQKYRQLLEYAPAGIYELDMDKGKIISVNDIICQYTGYSKEELLDMGPMDLLLGSSWERYSDRRSEILSGGQVPDSVEYEIEGKDGTRIWASFTTRLQVGEDGSTIATVVAHDISGRKRAEDALRLHKEHLEDLVAARTADLAATNAHLRAEIEEKERTEQALRQSEQRYQQLVNLSQAGIYEVDLKKNQFSSVNNYMCRYTGYSRSELLKMRPLEILAPESQAVFMERQKTVSAGETVPEDIEYEIVRKDATTIWATISSTLVFEDDKPSKAIVVAHDVTQRIQAERQLRAALREKEVLLQEVHHRVKNNLQLVSSLLDMQSMSIQDAEPLSVLQDSRNRVKAMALVHETLYQASDLASIDVAGYLRGVVGNLVGIYQSGTRPVMVDIQVEAVALDLDTAITCGLIVNELVSNALKYAFARDWQGLLTEDREGVIRVRLQQQTSHLLGLAISDNGIGIPPDIDMDHAHSLGLRLVTMLTEQLGGTVELDRDGGTAFRISFPWHSKAIGTKK